MKTIILSILALVLIGPLSAATLFNQSFTPTFLANNATFPHGSRSLASGGGSLDLNSPRPDNYVRILEIGLIAPGVIASGSSVTIDVSVDIARFNSSDNDLSVLVIDGVNAAGARRLDNNGGTVQTRDNTVANLINGGFSVEGSEVSTSVTTPFNNVFSTQILASSNSSTQVTATMNNVTTSVATLNSRSIDPTLGLSLVLMSNHTNEGYRVFNITASVEGTPAVPEASSFFLVLGALVFGVGLKKKRR